MNQSNETLAARLEEAAKILRSVVERVVAAKGSQLSEAMMAWSKAWFLDGDLCRCRKCGRGIIISRTDEAFHHAADCPQAHLVAPWQDLRSRIPAMLDSSDDECRRQFEHQYQGLDLQRRPSGVYHDPATDDRWVAYRNGWNARGSGKGSDA